MSKEELEKEAEEKTKQYMCENTLPYNCERTKLENDNYNVGLEIGYKDGYLAAAEPREMRIEQLEKENTELREKLEDTEKARDYWKGSSFDWRHKCISRKPFKAAVKAQKQLSKAKELIEDLYSQIPSSHSDYYKDVMERARQFIKEVEE